MKKNSERQNINQKGITLISLVVTIIVLTILASIVTYIGADTLREANLTKFIAELKVMQIEVNELYDAYKNGKTINVGGTDYTGDEILNIGKETTQVSEEAEEAFSGAEIASEYTGGYKYYDKETLKGLQIEGLEREFLINIEKRSVVSLKGCKDYDNMYYTIEQVPDGLYNVDKTKQNAGEPTFSAKSSNVGDSRWKIEIYNINYTPTEGGNVNKWKVKYRLQDTENEKKWSFSDSTTFFVEKKGVYEIKIYNGNIENSEAYTLSVSDYMNENTEYEDTDGNIAIIPKGFKIADDSAEKVEDGIVIEDKIGNQFVWVPVADFSEFEREAGYYDGVKQSITFTSTGLTSSQYYEPKGDGTTVDTTASEDIQEAQKMYKSVKYNGGFYIGRYETGFEGETAKENYTSYTTYTQDNVDTETEKLVVKANAQVYNYVPWGAGVSDTSAVNKGTTDSPTYVIGAVELARNFDSINGYTNVTSTLCYGVQWDAVMRWMESIENPNATGSLTKYIQDSTGMGWYLNNYSSGNLTHKTGIDVDANASNKVKNIYDIAGNVFEWTMEAYYTDHRVYRGGNYYDTGSGNPASYRNYCGPTNTFDNICFHIALFLETLDSTAETTPFLLEGATVTNNDLDTGLTIEDSNGNEWVWIEVPKSVTASATTDEDIETALKDYAATVVTDRGNYKDEWYAAYQENLVTASTEGLTDEIKALDNGCGLTYDEYYTTKSTMLQSIKTNGGFYIGKYEVGYELKEGESVRSYGDDYYTEHPIAQRPVIKQNAYPYNWVRCSQAQELSESLKTGGKTTSLTFGLQWDLVLKYLYEKNNNSDILTSDSSEWGNYANISFEVTQGKYSEDNGENWIDVSGTYSKASFTGILLSTGIVERNSILNVYDLAGNLYEFTLERGVGDSNVSSTFRGGGYNYSGADDPASYRGTYGWLFSVLNCGFRAALY